MIEGEHEQRPVVAECHLSSPYLAEATGSNVVDEAGGLERGRQQLRLAHTPDALAHALLEVAERLEVDIACVQSRGGELAAKLLRVERDQAALRMRDHEDL